MATKRVNGEGSIRKRKPNQWEARVTSHIDPKTGKQVMALFRELNEEGRTIIMITHDINIAAFARRTVHIIDGVLTEGGGTDA